MQRRNVPPPVYNEDNLHKGLLDERRSKRGNQNQSGTICVQPIMMGTLVGPSQGTSSSIETQSTALPLVENNSEAQTIAQTSDAISSQPFVDRSQLPDEMSSSRDTEHSRSRSDPVSPTSSINNSPDESLCQNPSSPKPSTSSGMFEFNNLVLSTPKFVFKKALIFVAKFGFKSFTHIYRF